MKDTLIKYTENDLLRVAKRFRNKKRAYLLVNPLQAKHIAVKPSHSLDLFLQLGLKVKSEYPGARLVIGFAETATAVGMAVSEELGEDCVYIHTTRERINSVDHWIEFKEEHSHAVLQKLAAANLREWLHNTTALVFVDDEITTGKTIINFVKQLRESCPDIRNIDMAAASIINRVSAQNRERLHKYGIKCISLLSMEETDYSDVVDRVEIKEAKEPVLHSSVCNIRELPVTVQLADPRTGINAAYYKSNCLRLADEVIRMLPEEKRKGRILVLGTEECMYPAILLGKRLEDEGVQYSLIPQQEVP